MKLMTETFRALFEGFTDFFKTWTYTIIVFLFLLALSIIMPTTWAHAKREEVYGSVKARQMQSRVPQVQYIPVPENSPSWQCSGGNCKQIGGGTSAKSNSGDEEESNLQYNYMKAVNKLGASEKSCNASQGFLQSRLSAAESARDAAQADASSQKARAASVQAELQLAQTANREAALMKKELEKVKNDLRTVGSAITGPREAAPERGASIPESALVDSTTKRHSGLGDLGDPKDSSSKTLDLGPLSKLLGGAKSI